MKRLVWHRDTELSHLSTVGVEIAELCKRRIKGWLVAFVILDLGMLPLSLIECVLSSLGLGRLMDGNFGRSTSKKLIFRGERLKGYSWSRNGYCQRTSWLG